MNTLELQSRASLLYGIALAMEVGLYAMALLWAVRLASS